MNEDELMALRDVTPYFVPVSSVAPDGCKVVRPKMVGFNGVLWQEDSEPRLVEINGRCWEVGMLKGERVRRVYIP